MPFENKLVVVLNEKVEKGKAMMALSHAMLGFGASSDAAEVKLNKYIDADNGVHENISEMPIVVLKANSNKIRTLRKLAQEHNVKFVDFTESMSIGTYQEEYDLTKTLKDEELNYWAIVLYGPWDTVAEWTKKFSLYR
ncbi:MAG: DUF2000 domain-containing protein [Candidatus Woesearchaeota archaeon]|nr:DUF2000 domain-containing protein [Candidatus Woesearchaeota archaeon]